jgi:hypothetical protein
VEMLITDDLLMIKDEISWVMAALSGTSDRLRKLVESLDETMRVKNQKNCDGSKVLSNEEQFYLSRTFFIEHGWITILVNKLKQHLDIDSNNPIFDVVYDNQIICQYESLLTKEIDSSIEKGCELRLLQLIRDNTIQCFNRVEHLYKFAKEIKKKIN